MVEFKHYDLVPKDYYENIEWRRAVLHDAAEDPDFAAAIRHMCSEDLLFYINGFCWTYDPRDTVSPAKPFITYSEYQDDALAVAVDGIERGYDVAWPKSRTMGASWMGLTVFEWLWHFREALSFLLVSRNQDYVDQSGNPKSLFWKIDFLHKNQPKWLLPTGRWLGQRDPCRKSLHLRNADNGSVIDGESTTGDAGRGDRRTAMFIDEHAAFELNEGFKILRSSRDTTRCRFFNSTPQGAHNAFYEVVHNSGAKVFRMHWSKHPEYARGLYTSVRAESGEYELKVVDEGWRGWVDTMRKGWDGSRRFRFPLEYPFILDGRIRSPWYDAECARCVSDQEIAQELDIDFLGSDYQFFDHEFIEILIREYCIKPIHVGELSFDSMSLEPRGFMQKEGGPLHLWFPVTGSGNILDGKKSLSGGMYAIGADVSFGTGASNSVASIVDRQAGRKIGVWRSPDLDPERFCDEVIALAKWFNDAFLIWDATGAAGRSFTKRVIDRRYSKIYYRRNEERTRSRVSDQPGYYMTPEDKTVLLRDYRGKLQDRKFINPSESGMQECLQFIVQSGGKVEHSKAANSQDPTGARDAHGDEVIADALASRVLSFSSKELKSEEKSIPWMSPAWRFREEARAKLVGSVVDW